MEIDATFLTQEQLPADMICIVKTTRKYFLGSHPTSFSPPSPAQTMSPRPWMFPVMGPNMFPKHIMELLYILWNDGIISILIESR